MIIVILWYKWLLHTHFVCRKEFHFNVHWKSKIFSMICIIIMQPCDSFIALNFVIFKISFHVGVVFSRMFVTGESLFTVDTCFQKVHLCIFIIEWFCTFKLADCILVCDQRRLFDFRFTCLISWLSWLWGWLGLISLTSFSWFKPRMLSSNYFIKIKV